MPINTLPEVDLRSEEFQEVVGPIPGWLSRWGITFLFVFILIIIGLSWFIQYPDMVRASITITTTPPPITLSSRSQGNILLLKNENDRIVKDEVIALIKSTASFEAVQRLEKALLTTNPSALTVDPTFDLGELEPSFASFSNATIDLENFTELDSYNRQIDELQEQERSYGMLSAALAAQLRIASKELVLAHERFKRDSLLASQKVLSAQDYSLAWSAYLQNIRSHQNFQSSIISNKIQIDQIKKQIADLRLQRQEKQISLNQNYQNAKRDLCARILQWKQTYLFVAPVNGKLAYLDFLQNNTLVEQGKQLFAIVPASDKIFAQAKIPISGSGKVKIGQHVNIRLEDFPFEQFGMLKGKVVEISELPVEKNYLAKIMLTHQLTTTYKKKLPFKRALYGDTEIITEDLRVAERIFYQLRSLIKD